MTTQIFANFVDLVFDAVEDGWPLFGQPFSTFGPAVWVADSLC